MNNVNRSFLIDRLMVRLPWANRWGELTLAAAALLLSLSAFWLLDGWAAYQIYGATAIHLLFPPVVIGYMLIMVRILERTRIRVAQSLRPIVQLKDKAFEDVVERGCRSSPKWELGAFVLGAIFFVAVEGRFRTPPIYFWASLYYYVISLIMFATVGWSVYAVIIITRLTNVLLRQPLEIDLFDQAPLKSIGLQSLSLSLAFIGAIILGIPSSPYPAASWQNFVIFGALLLVSVLVFYLNMYATHRLLKRLRDKQLVTAESQFSQAYLRLQMETASSGGAPRAATEVSAWLAVKHELKQAQTWPYNTEMLRTLFVSVLAPIALVLARVVGPLLAAFRQMP